MAYDIGCDEGGADEFMRKLWCAAQATPFSVGKWFIGLGTDLIDWALEFRVAEVLTDVGGTLSRVYRTSLVGPIRIADLAWTVTLIVGGLAILRGRVSHGAREIFTTFVLAILGGMMLANPDGYLEGASALAQNTSGAVLEAVDGSMNTRGAGDSEEVRGQLSRILQRSFVAEPYDLLNWGEPLSGECAEARNLILSFGPWGSHDQPRDVMREHGCERQADYNAEPTDNRAMASLTVTAAAILVTMLLVSLALAVFMAQITLVMLFAGASLVWVVALFPMARSILWWWLSRLVWAVVVTVTAVFLLSWVAVTTTVVLDNTGDMEIIQRCLIIVVVAAVAYKFRGAIDRALDGAGNRIATILNRTTSPGASATDPAPGRAASGMSLSPIALVGGVAFGATAGLQRARSVGTRVPIAAAGVGAGAVAASRATHHGARRVGRNAAAAGSSVVMAPVVLPQRRAERRVARQGQRSTRSSQVRERMAQARDTRRQWARSVRHPIQTNRDARRQAEGGSDHLDWM